MLGKSTSTCWKTFWEYSNHQVRRCKHGKRFMQIANERPTHQVTDESVTRSSQNHWSRWDSLSAVLSNTGIPFPIHICLKSIKSVNNALGSNNNMQTSQTHNIRSSAPTNQSSAAMNHSTSQVFCQTVEPDVGSTSPDTERSPRTARALIKLWFLAFCISSLQLHLVHKLFLLCFETPQKNHSAAGKKMEKHCWAQWSVPLINLLKA